MRSSLSQYLYPVYSWEFPFPFPFFLIRAHFLSPHDSTVGKIKKRGNTIRKKREGNKRRVEIIFFEGFYIHRCNSQRGEWHWASRAIEWRTSKQTFLYPFPIKGQRFFFLFFLSFFLFWWRTTERQSGGEPSFNSKEATSPLASTGLLFSSSSSPSTSSSSSPCSNIQFYWLRVDTVLFTVPIDRFFVVPFYITTLQSCNTQTSSRRRCLVMLTYFLIRLYGCLWLLTAQLQSAELSIDRTWERWWRVGSQAQLRASEPRRALPSNGGRTKAITRNRVETFQLRKSLTRIASSSSSSSSSSSFLLLFLLSGRRRETFNQPPLPPLPVSSLTFKS